MLKISPNDIKRLVQIEEYLVQHDNAKTIQAMMTECKIDFQTYRQISAIAAPAIRQKNKYNSAKQSLGYYKGLYTTLKETFTEMTEALHALGDERVDAILEQHKPEETHLSVAEFMEDDD